MSKNKMTIDPTQYTPLTKPVVDQMVRALQRINEIKAGKKPDEELGKVDAEEVQTHIEFLTVNFVRHARDFLGAWITIFEEYDPLIKSFGFLQVRAANYAQKRMAMLNGVAPARETDEKKDTS